MDVTLNHLNYFLDSISGFRAAEKKALKGAEILGLFILTSNYRENVAYVPSLLEFLLLASVLVHSGDCHQMPRTGRL